MLPICCKPSFNFQSSEKANFDFFLRQISHYLYGEELSDVFNPPHLPISFMRTNYISDFSVLTFPSVFLCCLLPHKFCKICHWIHHKSWFVWRDNILFQSKIMQIESYCLIICTVFVFVFGFMSIWNLCLLWSQLKGK